MTEQENKEIADLQDELICKGGEKKGKPKKDADINKLARLRDLVSRKYTEDVDQHKADVEAFEAEKAKLAEEKATLQTEKGSADKGSDKLKRMADELKAKNKEIRSLRAPKAPSKPSMIDGEYPREEELMNAQFGDAVLKEKSEMTETDIVCIERQIRRTVKKGGMSKPRFVGDPVKEISGGYRKDVTDLQKNDTVRLLELLGRVDAKGDVILAWDETIMVPGFVAEGLGAEFKKDVKALG